MKAKRPLNPEAVKVANEKLWNDNPELKRRKLTMSPDQQEYEYRKQWMKAYQEGLKNKKKKDPTSGGDKKVDDPSKPCPACSTADLTVTVTDQRDGSQIEGAKVQIAEPESRTSTTDKNGRVTFRGIKPSPPDYKISATKDGYHSLGWQPEAKGHATVIAGGPTPTEAALILRKTILLADTDKWFKDKIILQRTAWSGFSPNRIWKSPRGLVVGNQPDPNGLCGDASQYVHDEMYDNFDTWETDDRYRMALIKWEGAVFNHIANVMVKKGKVAVQEYKMSGGKLRLVSGTAQYTQAELMDLHVYDLYYKKLTTVSAWWKDRDDMGGTIKIAVISEME